MLKCRLFVKKCGVTAVFRCPLEFMGRTSVKNLNKVIEYHDTRWCKPVHDDNELFAMLCLEILQAGLSWQTILVKEPTIRMAFNNFHIKTVANFTQNNVEILLKNQDIIKNKRKISAIINNAKMTMSLKKNFGTFNEFIWQFVNFKQIDNKIDKISNMCTKNKLSELISVELKKTGFKFVGPTIIYSYLQAIGIVNDHHIMCDYR